MVKLVSRVILDFVQRDFKAFEDFEVWMKRLQYSVTLPELYAYIEEKKAGSGAPPSVPPQP